MTQTQCIRVNNEALAQRHPMMLLAVLGKAKQFHASSVEITPTDRLPSGWLEWGIQIHSGSQPLHLAAIQREPAGSYEFHS